MSIYSYIGYAYLRVNHEEVQVKASTPSNSGCANCTQKTRHHPKELIPIGFAAAAFILALIFEDRLHNTFFSIPEYLIFLSIYIFSGWNVLLTAFRNIIKGKIFDENFLMMIATAGAIAIHALPEAVGVMLFYRVGEFLEKLTITRSRQSIKALLAIRPDSANLKIEIGYKKVPPETVNIGQTVLVKPGERVPLDGTIISGSSRVDTSALTGESVPVNLKEGDAILSGMIVSTNSLQIKITKLFNESAISRILHLVENAVKKKAQTERFITTFARYYTPIVVAIALITALIPPFLFQIGSFQEWVYRALVILVISCPCALVISIPLGYFGGIGAASKKGILIKGSNYIDLLNDVDTIVFDKTGTLTKGIFKVTKIAVKNGFTEDEILRYAAYAESHSNHPIADAIKKACGTEINPHLIDNHKEIPGYGVKASVFNKLIIAGNDRLLHKENITHEDCNIQQTAAHIAVDNKYAGYIIISDEERPDTKDAISALKKLGINNIIMLTGDTEKTAEYYAEKFNIDKYHAELLPEDKVRILEEIMENSRGKVAFIGDGINDAPVIAQADIGFAMGKSGSDAAIENADIVLMTDAPGRVPEVIKLSRRIRTIILQNIVFALIIKLTFVLMGATGLAGMWEAVFADVGVTLLAILNVLRVMKEDHPDSIYPVPDDPDLSS